MRGILLLIILALATILSGCVDNPGNETNSQDPTTTPTPPVVPTNVTHNVTLSGAYPVNIAYVPARIEVGNNTNVTINFTNTDQNPVAQHDWVLEGVENASTEVVANGVTTSTTFMAPPPGSYTFYCSVTGHRENGMEGEFVVTA